MDDLEETSQPQAAAGLGQQVAGVNKLENDPPPSQSGKKRREAKQSKLKLKRKVKIERKEKIYFHFHFLPVLKTFPHTFLADGLKQLEAAVRTSFMSFKGAGITDRGQQQGVDDEQNTYLALLVHY